MLVAYRFGPLLVSLGDRFSKGKAHSVFHP